MEQFVEVPEFLDARAGRISECRTALPQKHGRPSWVIRHADGGRRVDTKRDGGTMVGITEGRPVRTLPAPVRIGYGLR